MPFFNLPSGASPVLSGDGPPSSGIGNDGDLYFDQLNLRIYGPKTLGDWGGGFSIVGNQTDASALTTGTLADGRLSENVVFTDDPRLSDSRSPSQHTHVIADVSTLQATLDGLQPAGDYATVAEVTAATAGMATESWVQSQIAGLADTAPELLNTLAEIAAALGNDPNFAATITAQIAGKADLDHSHVIADVSGLQAALDNRSLIGHAHTSADVSDFAAAAAANAPVQSVSGLTGNLTLVAGDNVTISASGENITIASTASGGGMTWASEPANSSSPGNAGDVAYGGLYFYVHNGTQWNRVLLSSFGDGGGGGGGGGGNVTTYRLLTEGGDALLTEGGDYLTHYGTGSGSGTAWSLVNAEIAPYGSTGWLQFGGNGTLVAPYQEGNDLVLADNGTGWQSSLTRSQYDSLTGYSHAANLQLMSITRNSSGNLNAELLLARDASVVFGMAAPDDRYIYRLQLQSGTWSKSPSAALSYGVSPGNLLAACSRNGDYFVFGQRWIRVFDLSGDSWSPIGEINLTGVLTDDTQVRRLGISNNGLVCSVAVENTHDAASNKFDRIRSFEWTGSTWAERTALTVAASYVCDWTPDHSRVVIGQYDHTGTATQGGRVQVFALSGSTWSQVGSDILGGANYDYLGYSVSISSDGNTIAIGVRGEDDAGANAGAARVYEWSGSDWQQVGADIDGEAAGDYAGDQIELSGGRVAVSAPGADGAGTNRGQVRVFEWA